MIILGGNERPSGGSVMCVFLFPGKQDCGDRCANSGDPGADPDCRSGLPVLRGEEETSDGGNVPAER